MDGESWEDINRVPVYDGENSATVMAIIKVQRRERYRFRGGREEEGQSGAEEEQSGADRERFWWFFGGRGVKR